MVNSGRTTQLSAELAEDPIVERIVLAPLGDTEAARKAALPTPKSFSASLRLRIRPISLSSFSIGLSSYFK
jgi:hypothetical protein